MKSAAVIAAFVLLAIFAAVMAWRAYSACPACECATCWCVKDYHNGYDFPCHEKCVAWQTEWEKDQAASCKCGKK